jgi:hypothetical protein
VAGVALQVHGGAVASAGLANIAEDLGIVFHSSHNNSQNNNAPQMRSQGNTNSSGRGVGRIRDLHGKSLKWIIKQKPKGWKTVPSDNGLGWKWIDENGIERLRFTRPSGENAANSQWSRQENGYFRWKNEKDEFLDIDGKVVPNNDPDLQFKTHIPYEGTN